MVKQQFQYTFLNVYRAVHAQFYNILACKRTRPTEYGGDSLVNGIAVPVNDCAEMRSVGNRLLKAFALP